MLTRIACIALLAGCRTTAPSSLPAAKAPPIEHLDVTTQPQDTPAFVASAGAFFQVPTAPTVQDLVFEERTGKLFAAASEGLFTSDDQGRTWKALRDKLACRAVMPAPSGLLYAVCGTELHVHENGAWRKLSLPRGPRHEIVPHRIALSPARPGRIYVAGRGEADHNGLYSSDDGGRTWKGIESILVPDDDGTEQRIAPVDEAVLGFALHPSNPDVVVAQLTYGPFISTDGGKTFTKAGLLRTAPSLPAYTAGAHAYVQASRVFFDAADPRTSYVLGDGALAITRDGGVTWQRQPSALDALAAHPRVGGALYGRAGGTYLVSRDHGASWQPVAPVAVPGAERAFFPGWTAPVSPVKNAVALGEAPLAVSPQTGRVFGGAPREGFVVMVGVR